MQVEQVQRLTQLEQAQQVAGRLDDADKARLLVWLQVMTEKEKDG